MPTITEQYQTQYQATFNKWVEARAASGPNISVDGASVDRMGYIKDLRDELDWLEKKPGVVPEIAPTFEVFG